MAVVVTWFSINQLVIHACGALSRAVIWKLPYPAEQPLQSVLYCTGDYWRPRLEEACHELDMKLAFHHNINISQHHVSFAQYTEALRDMTKTRADLEAQQSTSVLEQLMVFSSGKENPSVHRLLNLYEESRTIRQLV